MDNEKKVLGVLKRHKYGLTINKVSELTGLHRITASKYLAVLEAKGRVVLRKVGKAKLYYLKENFTKVEL